MANRYYSPAVWDLEADRKVDYGVSKCVFWYSDTERATPKATYETLAALKAGVPNPSYGDIYAVYDTKDASLGGGIRYDKKLNYTWTGYSWARLKDEPVPIPWTGVKQITINYENGDGTELYSDNMMYGRVREKTAVSLDINCWTYPTEFDKCLGYAPAEFQDSSTLNAFNAYAPAEYAKFGIAWQDVVIDANGNKFTKTYICYDCEVISTDTTTYTTLSDSVDPTEFTFNVAIRPRRYKKMPPLHYISMDSSNLPTTGSSSQTAFEDWLNHNFYNVSEEVRDFETVYWKLGYGVFNTFNGTWGDLNTKSVTWGQLLTDKEFWADIGTDWT